MGSLSSGDCVAFSAYELQSKLLKGGSIGDYRLL